MCRLVVVSRGYSSFQARRLLAVASLVAEHRLSHMGFSICGSWALELMGSAVVAHRLRSSIIYGIFLD